MGQSSNSPPPQRSVPDANSLLSQDTREFNTLVELMKVLTGPDGCPWDKEQSHNSLAPHLIEETYEVIDAIESGSSENLKEELGDLLLQIIFHSELAHQRGSFDIHDVITCINEKMIRRHPHVFADSKLQTSQEVKKQWEEIKNFEKSKSAKKTESMGGSLAVPALQRSQKIGAKTKQEKFDWDLPSEVFRKIEEEVSELKQAMDIEGQVDKEHEIGDLLFTVAQLARHYQIDAESALRKTNLRFENRFFKMKGLVFENHLVWEQLSVEEKNLYWSKAKKLLKD